MSNKDEKFDVIFAARVIHIGTRDIMKTHIENILAYLKPGGKAIIETTSPWS